MLKPKFLILLFFFFAGGFQIQSQEFTLKVVTSPEVKIDLPDYSQKFTKSENLKKEVYIYGVKLQKMGFLNSKLDSLVHNDKLFTAYFSLGKRTEELLLLVRIEDQAYLPSYLNRRDSIQIPFEKTEELLGDITTNLEAKGQAFSKVSLKNLQMQKGGLTASLSITNQQARKIDTLIIKGYTEFPQKFIKRYLSPTKGSVFSQKQLDLISRKVNALSFVNQTKFPEALFTKDSTKIYVYMSRKETSSIDANINFTGSESESIQFNGLVDLQLNNIFNKGSRIALFWNAAGNQREELRFSTSVPYIYGGKFSPAISFSLFKQDSTFINTKLNIDVKYPLSDAFQVGLNYTTESSTDLINQSQSISSFSNNFFGISSNYLQLNQVGFFPRKFETNVHLLFGNRNAGGSSSSQIKFTFDASYLWELNPRNFISLKNSTGFLNSDAFFDNELFRIGGINSIRGFNDQSIFTDRFTIMNLEYRFLTNNSSYFFTITDYANARVNLNGETFMGLGLGYFFTVKNSQFNLGAALGKTSNQNFNFSDTQLLISWKNFF
ncbi:MAG: hypothetical protein CMB99_04675 [Flavobacteriaceae bacterium]|nr:hypothetical protein [Flavobacteriaceae bacterium]|tara:strand:+ start:157070 stop:158719 length:1650 start_codon:yes stop_codon:yes gene_type:complete